MAATYDQNGLEFLYPENWSLTESDETSDFFEISLESPTGAIWSVSVFPPDSDVGQLLDSCAEALREQYDDFEQFAYSGSLGEFAATGFDGHFYCLDFLVTAGARAFSMEDRTLIVFWQAESREYDSNREVLDAITLSLLQKKTQLDNG